VRIGAHYSHLNGLEWIQVHRPQAWEEITAVVKQINAEKCRTKVSKEEGMKGRLLFSPDDLNMEFKSRLDGLGWKSTRTTYWVTDDFQLIRKTMQLSRVEQKTEIEAAGKEPILSYNQTDFVKERVAVEVQLGKYSFIAYDLFVKHLAFYIGDVGVEILPMKAMQREMSSGPGYYEGALYDVARQGRVSPPVPLVIVGIEP